MTALAGPELERQIARLTPAHAAYIKHQLEWASTARLSQMPPEPEEQEEWLRRVNEGLPADRLKALCADPKVPWTEWGMQAGRGTGKLLDVKTPIPTPYGWCAIGELALGDEVFDETGAPCRVTALFDDTPGKAYRLTFSDNTTIDACADHQWVSWTHRDRKQYLRNNAPVDEFPANWPAYRQALYHPKIGITGYCGPEIRTTQQIVDTFTHSTRGDLNHCIPVCGDLRLPEADLPLDPWLLGYWLGNGATKDVRVSCHDADVEAVEGAFAAVGFVITRSPSMPQRDFRAGGLQRPLKALFVFADKRIPAPYLRASARQRRALLAGLLDSDGHCAKHGYVEFCSTNRTLAEGVVELARSLGQKPVLAEGRAKLYGKDCGPKYRVTWRSTYNPFSLPRKAAAWRPLGAQALRNKHRMIVAFEEIASAPMRCITVDSPNSMYLAGEGMIPTHNTKMGAEWLLKDAWEDPKALPRCVIAPTQADVKHTCFEGVSGLVTIAPPAIVANYNRSELVLELKNGATIRGFSAEKPERLRGPEHASAWCFVAGTPVRMADGSEKPIETVEVGDVVATRHGPRRVLRSGRSANPSPRYRLSYGLMSLTATGDHPILTTRGWVPAAELEGGDLVWQLCGTAATRGGSPRTGITTGGAPRFENTSTGRFTRTTTDPSRTAGTSTTRTTTPPTTILATLKSCLRASTAGITEQVRRSLHTSTSAWQRVCESTWMLGSSRLSSAPLAATASSDGAISRHAHSAPVRAKSAGAGTPSRVSSASAESATSLSGPSDRQNCFAATGATCGTKSVGPLSTEHLGHARSARPSSNLSGTTTTSAPDLALCAVPITRNAEKLATSEPVYNLTVEGEHEFIAGGIIVHNCDELAAWGPDGEDVLDMMLFGLRIGDNPRFIWTSTPRPIPLVRKLIKPQPGRIIMRGSTYDNKANLNAKFLEKIAAHEGTRLGRQEIHGEMLDPNEAGIIRKSWIRLWPHGKTLPTFTWIILSLDTAFTERTRAKTSNSEADILKGDPDPTACGVYGVFEHEKRTNIMLLDSWDDHLGLPELVRRVKREAAKSYGDDRDTALIQPLFGAQKPLGSGRRPDVILIEDKGSGISLRQSLNELGVETYAYNPGRADKLARLHIVSPIFSQKRFWVPESGRKPGEPTTWSEKLIDQLCTFAGTGSLRHDDHLDACTQALRLCADKGLLLFTTETAEQKRTLEREREADEAVRTSLAGGYENPYDC